LPLIGFCGVPPGHLFDRCPWRPYFRFCNAS
jgi:hypothetical protein